MADNFIINAKYCRKILPNIVIYYFVENELEQYMTIFGDI